MSNVTQRHQAMPAANVSSQQQLLPATEDENKKTITALVAYAPENISYLKIIMSLINALIHQFCHENEKWHNLDIKVDEYDITRSLSEITDTANSNDPLKPYQLIILLLSFESVGLDFYYSEQMRPVFENHKQIQNRLRCVLLHPCTLAGYPFRSLPQSCYLPTNQQPIVKWDKEPEALANISSGLERAIDFLSAR